MEELTKSEVVMRQNELLQRIIDGEVFIHPTDTIYGIGCSATDERAVKKIRKLKERPDAPFSVWAPSKQWILDNCEVRDEQWLNQLPGSVTLIMKLKKKSGIAKSVSPGSNTVGVRLPDHWFSGFVERLGVPIVTTSVNRAGRLFMTSLEDLDADISNGVRFVVYEGEKSGRPSKIVHLEEGGRVQER
jgi:L-threonylcarbamoyladenylate synthase